MIPNLPSDWISSTSKLEWAVWEIARRHIRVGREEVELTLIRRQRRYGRGYKRTKAITVETCGAIERFCTEECRTHGREHEEASKYARLGGGAWVGRVFEKDVLEMTIWTDEVGHPQ